MANSEACELYIEQELKEGLKEGKNPHQIGQELSAWIAKLFQVHIPERTLEQRARRVNKREKIQRPREKKASAVAKESKEASKDNRGGRREGAGRPVDESLAGEKKCMAIFSNALDQIEAAVNNLYDIGGKYWERNQDEIVFTLKAAYDNASEKRGYFEAEKDREKKARSGPEEEKEKKEQPKSKSVPANLPGLTIPTTEAQHKLIKRLFSEDEDVTVRVKYFNFARNYTDSILSELKKLEMVDPVAAKLIEKIKLI